MRMKKSILTLCSLLCVGSMSAQFILVEDGEDISEWTVAFNGEAEANPVGSVTSVDDPFGLGQGKVVCIDPGVAGATTHNVISGFTLPESMHIVAADGAEATMYFKIGRPSVGGNPGNADITFGIGGGDISSPFAYSNYSAYSRYDADGIMDWRNGGSFESHGSVQHDTDIYYEVWYVIDHWNQTYSMYVKGGTDYPEQTEWVTGAAYRNETFEDLDEVFSLTSAGNTTAGVKGQDPVYYDDVYIDASARNLTSPTGGVVPTGPSKLVNISTRGDVGAGNDSLIGGFVIEGSENMTVLIQGVGEELIGSGGLTTADVLADGQLLLVMPDGSQVSNDDWESEDAAAKSTAMADAGSFVLASGSKSAAILVDLAPGLYTVILAGVNGAEGIALVEVYEVP